MRLYHKELKCSFLGYSLLESSHPIEKSPGHVKQSNASAPANILGWVPSWQSASTSSLRVGHLGCLSLQRTLAAAASETAWVTLSEKNHPADPNELPRMARSECWAVTNVILALEILHLKSLSLLLSLHHKHLSLRSRHCLKLFKNVFACWPGASVIWASSLPPKGYKFDSQSRYIPGLWVLSWLGRQMMNVSLTLPRPWPLR